MKAVVPAPVRGILEDGAFCHVATLTPTGPHVTPMVFATMNTTTGRPESIMPIGPPIWSQMVGGTGFVAAGSDTGSAAAWSAADWDNTMAWSLPGIE